MSNEATCPQCKSTSLSANTKGYSLTTGFIGSNKIIVTCINCGFKFKPSERAQIETNMAANARGELSQEQKVKTVVGIILLIVFLIWFFN